MVVPRVIVNEIVYGSDDDLQDGGRGEGAKGEGGAMHNGDPCLSDAIMHKRRFAVLREGMLQFG